MIKFARAALAAATMLCAVPAYALFPQQGMWTIGSEADGKPGRGIQLDRQGGQFLIVTYIGYRPDGTSAFMQASGKLVDGKSFSGQLTEYKNGRSLGGAAQSGEVAQVAGPVFIEFDSSTSGTITLPGEAPQRFSRFQYENHLSRINNRFSSVVFDNDRLSPRPVQVRIQASGMEFTMTEQYSNHAPGPGAYPTCTYRGDLRRAGDSFSSAGTVECTGFGSSNDTPEFYRLTHLKVDEYGTFSARLYWSSVSNAHPDITSVGWARHYSGACISNTGIVLGWESRCDPYQFGLTWQDVLE